jgi:hypothetical protein
MEFIMSYANLIATAMSIPENRDLAAVTAIASSAQA